MNARDSAERARKDDSHSKQIHNIIALDGRVELCENNRSYEVESTAETVSKIF